MFLYRHSMECDDSAAEVIVTDFFSQSEVLSCYRSLISAESERCILSKVPYFADMLESINDAIIHETYGI